MKTSSVISMISVGQPTRVEARNVASELANPSIAGSSFSHLGLVALMMIAFSCTHCFGQVQLDGELLLNGTLPSDRQITGLPDSNAPADVLTAGTAQRGAMNSAIAVAGNTWSVELPAFGAAPVVGSHLVLLAPATTVGTVSLLLNGAGPFQVMQGTSAVDGSSLEPGAPISLVFDGTAFQVLNGRNDQRRPCLSGMVAVNEQYCMETTERPAVDFFDAAVGCAEAGRRLCSWGEFIAACQEAGALGLTGMINGWEWTNNTSNEDGTARIVGAGDCEAAGTWFVTGNSGQAYRCCYTR